MLTEARMTPYIVVHLPTVLVEDADVLQDRIEVEGAAVDDRRRSRVAPRSRLGFRYSPMLRFAQCPHDSWSVKTNMCQITALRALGLLARRESSRQDGNQKPSLETKSHANPRHAPASHDHEKCLE